MALAVILGTDRILEGLFLVLAPAAAAGLDAIALDGGQHAGRLLATHHRDAGIRPHEQKPRAVGPAAPAVIAGTIRAADDDGEFRHLGARPGGNQLGAVAGDAAGLVFLADHDSGMYLQAHQRDLALAATTAAVRALG